MKIYFLLPAYNEESAIEIQIQKLIDLASHFKLDFSVTVVNDGSSDRTPQMVEDFAKRDPRVFLVNQVPNQGPGAAFDRGFRDIIGRAKDEDAIITMDADNTHSEKTIQFMLSRLNEGYELVIASVFAPGGMMIGVPFLRYVLSWGCNRLYRLFFPVSGICEYTGFYRAYQVKGLRAAYARFAERGKTFITATGFSCAAEIVVKCRQIPLFMTEVPMMVRYDLKSSKSKMRIGRTIREHVRIITQNLLARSVI